MSTDINLDPTTLCGVINRFALANCHPDDQPLAFQVSAAILAADSETLGTVVKQLDPFEFINDRNRFNSRRQLLSLFSKTDIRGVGNNEQRQAAALLKWHAAENRCRRTNRRIAYFRARPWRLQRRSPVLFEIISTAVKQTQRLLGKLDYDAVLAASRPGPGVTQGTKQSFNTHAYQKLFDTEHTCSPGVLPLVSHLLNGSAWKFGKPLLECEVVSSSRVTFVPKDWRNFRAIAIEPSYNTWFQLGVHEVLSRRLSRAGNNITDQRRNGLRAKMSDIATIDLASASDTVATETVRLLLTGFFSSDASTSNGQDWFEFLGTLRCTHSTLPNGESVKLEKFSSMGNGFTFVLETILFLSVARAVADLTGARAPTVYGDDIIIDQSAALLLIEALSFLGFEINQTKSFVVGPFRESCGYDWYEGVYVTPLHLRGKVHYTGVYQLLNDAGIDDSFDWTSVRSYLMAFLHQRRLLNYVTGDTPPTAGVQSNWGSVAKTYNRHTQAYMQKCWIHRATQLKLPDKGCLLVVRWYITSLLIGYQESGCKTGVAHHSAIFVSARRRGHWSRRNQPIHGMYIGPLKRKLTGESPY